MAVLEESPVEGVKVAENLLSQKVGASHEADLIKERGWFEKIHYIVLLYL